MKTDHSGGPCRGHWSPSKKKEQFLDRSGGEIPGYEEEKLEDRSKGIMSIDDAFNGFDCKDKAKKCVCSRRWFFLTWLYVLLFVAVEINTGTATQYGRDPWRG